MCAKDRDWAKLVERRLYVIRPADIANHNMISRRVEIREEADFRHEHQPVRFYESHRVEHVAMIRVGRRQIERTAYNVGRIASFPQNVGHADGPEIAGV